VSLYVNVPFIFECFMIYKCKKASQSTEPESHQTAKMFYFLLSSSSSSDVLVQNFVTLS